VLQGTAFPRDLLGFVMSLCAMEQKISWHDIICYKSGRSNYEPIGRSAFRVSAEAEGVSASFTARCAVHLVLRPNNEADSVATS